MKNKLVVRSRNVLKRNALRFAAALLLALASFVRRSERSSDSSTATS